MIKNNGIEFKPCPFCGQDEEISFGAYRDGNGNSHIFASCPFCDCRTASYNTEREALKAWNTRKGKINDD